MEKRDKVTAIVPAYNEEKRIGVVLQVLENADLVDNIVVVDDASSDKTGKIARNFDVSYHRNKFNMGKAYSMDKGVKISKSDIIFFCDADIVNLTPNIVNRIIEPVKEGKFKMFIGARNRRLLRFFEKFGIKFSLAFLSGERSIRREVWETLPDYYKKGFRVETGLNYLVGKRLGGFGQKIFNHNQTLKEKKYSFYIATKQRWVMNLHILQAMIRFNLYDRFKTLNY